jgi:hypothetical protein
VQALAVKRADHVVGQPGAVEGSGHGLGAGIDR